MIEVLIIGSKSGDLLPYPTGAAPSPRLEGSACGLVVRDGAPDSANALPRERLLTIRRDRHQIGLPQPSNNAVFHVISLFRARWIFVEPPSRSIFLFEHDLFGKIGAHFSGSCLSAGNPAPACRGPGTGPSSKTCRWSRCPWPIRP